MIHLQVILVMVLRHIMFLELLLELVMHASHLFVIVNIVSLTE